MLTQYGSERKWSLPSRYAAHVPVALVTSVSRPETQTCRQPLQGRLYLAVLKGCVFSYLLKILGKQGLDMYFSLLSYFISFKICLFCLKLEKILKSQKSVGTLTYFRRRSGNMVITLFKSRCYVQEHRSLVTKHDSLGSSSLSQKFLTKIFRIT